MENVKLVQFDWASLEERNIIKTHSEAGRILAMVGKDPNSMFDMALKLTDRLGDPTNKSESYKQIARDMFAAGYDVHEIINKMMTLNGEEYYISLGILGDVLETALYCGYYKYRGPVMSRVNLCKNDEDEDRKIYLDRVEVKFLAKIAKAFGENSLTREEIANLSKEDISGIRNHISKEILAYFGKT